MSKRSKFQFRLSSLLLVIAGVAAFLGFAQWRRASILRESQALEAKGFKLLWPGGSPGAIWPMIPEEAAFEFRRLPFDGMEIASVRYTRQEAIEYYESIFDRLNRLGVEYVLLVEDGKHANTYCSTKVPQRATLGP